MFGPYLWDGSALRAEVIEKPIVSSAEVKATRLQITVTPRSSLISYNSMTLESVVWTRSFAHRFAKIRTRRFLLYCVNLSRVRSCLMLANSKLFIRVSLLVQTVFVTASLLLISRSSLVCLQITQLLQYDCVVRGVVRHSLL
jgi:hypothetical protein